MNEPATPSSSLTELYESDDLSRFIGNQEIFPVLRQWEFFNHAGVSPLPRPAADALTKWAAESQRGAYLGTTWYADIEKLRQLCAKIINAHRDEVAFVKNTSEGISIVARGIDWQWGDRIVTTGVEYPSNIYPWMEVVRASGAKLVMVEEADGPDGARRVPMERILQEAADPKTRLVALSHVEFASGQRHDIAQVGKFCRAHGKLLCVDAIQSVGILPCDVQALNIDFLSADGHKWMLGPEGAGFFYCRRELIEHIRPLMVGWMNVIEAQDFGNYNYTLRPDAGRFECGSYNIPGLLALRASLELLAGAGIDAISGRIKLLGARLCELLQAKGYHIISPRRDDEWSGIISFSSPAHNHEEIWRTLRREHHIEIALREGRLRASPHFYNTSEQIDKLVELLPGH